MNGFALTLSPVFPIGVIGLLLSLGLAAVGALYRLNREKLGKKRALILAMLRMAAVVLILVCALNPARAVRQEQTVLPAVAVLVDMSATMGQPVADGKATRLDQARALLSGGSSPLLPALKERFRVDVYGLADAARPLAADELAGLTAGGNKADVGQALTALGGRHAAALLLSDGNVGWRNAPAQAVPVITVPMGNTAAYRDILIKAIKAPSLAFRGREAVIDVTIKSYGYAGLTLPVILKDSGKLLTAKDVRLDASPAEVTTSLTFIPDSVGRKNITVTVPRQAGENLTGNNAVDFSIKIIRDKTRILMVSGTPSVNYRFMRRAFKSDPSIDLLSFVILRTPSDILNVPTHEQSLIPFPVETLFTKELAGFDLVIFDNFNYSLYLRPEYLENLQQFVKEGGGFAVIGGPNLFNEGRDGMTPIAELLPARLGAEKFYRRDSPVGVRLSPSGAWHPIMQIRDEFKKDNPEQKRFWQEMPPLDGINLMDAKRSAAVLIESADGIPWPILTVSPHGNGRVLLLATDYAWKWYMGMVAAERGGQPYLRLFHRMVRWLAKDPDLDPVQITLPETGVVAGREVDVRIALQGEDPAGVPETAIGASVFDPAGVKIASKLKPLPEAGAYQVGFPTKTEGIYRLMVETPAGPQEASLIVAGPQERLDAAPDHDILKKIADATGGKYTAPGDGLLRAIEEYTRKAEERFVEEKRVPLWANPVVMAAILGFLSLEWFLRRRWGLS
ncbi:MAG: glutamine amidotransferase [Thermodesulfobacteriota bacterium]